MAGTPQPELGGASALVTGGAGFIGSHVIEALLAAGAGRVVALDDLSLGRAENVPEGVELVEGDAADLEKLQALGSFDLCVNMAVIPLPHSLEFPREHVAANVAMTTAVCEHQRLGGYGRLIHISSSEAYGTAIESPMTEDHPLLPHTPSAASKAATDLVVLSYHETFGLPVGVIRPFNTYGPRQNDKAYAGLLPVVINAVRDGEPVTIFGDGEQTRDLTYVTDAAEGIVAACASDRVIGTTTNLGLGREWTVNEQVPAILEALGKPDWEVRHGDPRPGDVRRLLSDTTRARERFGYAPSVGIDEGFRLTVDWYLGR